VRILVDTNVVLDLLLDRDPFSDAAARVFSLVEKSELEAFLCAITVTTIDYLLSRSLDRDVEKTALHRLLEMFEIAPVNRSVLEEALQSRMIDFEDAVLSYAANLVGATIIVTRNTKDFHNSPVSAMDPVEFLSGIE
jgi:predicted nucleic acid-binding protein